MRMAKQVAFVEAAVRDERGRLVSRATATFLIYRARLWSLKRRLEPGARQISVAPPAPAPAPTAVDNGTGERLATDSKVWPAT